MSEDLEDSEKGRIDLKLYRDKVEELVGDADGNDFADIALAALRKIAEAGPEYQDRFLVNDIGRELKEEAVDLVGWMLMFAQRIQLLLDKRFDPLDEKYWELFLSQLSAQGPAHLLKLRASIDVVLKEKQWEDVALRTTSSPSPE